MHSTSAGRLSVTFSLLAAVFLVGCATPHDARKDERLQSYASVASRPTTRPTRSVSSFSQSLMCMDQMLRSAELPTTLVTSKQIPDYSTKVPVATKDMIVTALSQMSRLSNAFRYVDYEVEIARQDTVQNLTTILLNNNQLQLQRPSLYFSGAIAFVDQNIVNNRMDVGTTASRLEVGYSQSRNASVVALDLHLGDFRTRTLMPGMDSANEVVIGTGGQGLDVAGRIGSYGVQFNVGRDYTQGTGAAVRTLVELATIELVGKWARVPYWQCLTLEQTHPDFQRQLRDWFDEGGPAVQYQLVKRALATGGYLQGDPDALANNSPAMREAFARFQADSGISVTGELDFPTYERALRGFVGVDATGRLARVGWLPTSATPVVTSEGAAMRYRQGDPSYAGTPQERTIDLQMENIMLERTALNTGEQVFLSMTVSRASHIACYLADARGSVMRLLPNAVNPRSLVSANQAIRIPDWMSPNPGFVMDAGVPGREGVVCLAGDEDLSPRLPDALNGTALVSIPSVHSLAEVVQAYRDAAAGAGDLAVAERGWNVVAKPAASTKPGAP
jgi:hypothetical protein